MVGLVFVELTCPDGSHWLSHRSVQYLVRAKPGRDWVIWIKVNLTLQILLCTTLQKQLCSNVHWIYPSQCEARWQMFCSNNWFSELLEAGHLALLKELLFRPQAFFHGSNGLDHFSEFGKFKGADLRTKKCTLKNDCKICFSCPWIPDVVTAFLCSVKRHMSFHNRSALRYCPERMQSYQKDRE